MVGAGIFLAVWSMLALGIHDFLAKKLLSKLKPLDLLFLEYLVGVIILLPLLPLASVELIPADSIYLLFLLGVFHVVGYGAMYRGFRVGMVSLVSPIAASYSLPVILLAHILLNESLSPLQWVGVMLIIPSVFLVFLERVKQKIEVARGAPYGLIALLAWTMTFFLYKPSVAIFGVILTVISFKIITLLLVTPKSFRILENTAKTPFLSVLILAILEVSVQLSYGYATEIEQISILVPIINCFPAVTIILAWIFLKERMQRHQIMGLCLLIPALAFLGLPV